MSKYFAYLKHAPLIFRIVRLQQTISRGGGQQAIKLLSSSQLQNKALPDSAAIDKCVNLGLRIGAAFGMLNSCLTRSSIRCLLYREKGIDAKVAFGVNKKGQRLDGHCWLTGIEPFGPSEPAGGEEFADTLIFPSPDK